MDRFQLVKNAYDRSNFLTPENPVYSERVKALVLEFYREDLGEQGDITSKALEIEHQPSTAQIISKAEGIIAGLTELKIFYDELKLKYRFYKRDGDKIYPKDLIVRLEGSMSVLLSSERTGLNLLQRMSGIATLTNKFVELYSPLGIAATRKTHWGLLDKRAVSVGGGLTHRLGLCDAILIKENHLTSLSLTQKESTLKTALTRAWKAMSAKAFIEIEVETVNEAFEAANTINELKTASPDVITPCIIMFDDMPPEQINEVITECKNQKIYDKILFEASGGIKEGIIEAYRDCGVDVISMGRLTHSPESLDLSQLFC
ncbi:MAG: carboxylating nicotinate-nucleotide diphosphorylase [Promethearchaeota archaeon]